MPAIFKGLFTFLSLYFSKIVTNLLKITENSNFDLCGTFLVNKHYCVVKDASDARGFKIPAEMVLELDASPRHIDK